MTNKRAIELLNRISDSQFDGPHGDERREALEMAVRALFSQQIVNDSQGLVNDCISRKMAIDAFEPEHDTDWYTPQIIEVLEALPPVQPTQTNAQPTQFNALDCVSRQQAIDAVVSAMIDGADAELVEGVMELLPPAQPQWIPCSERLPDYGVSVLTWDGYCYCVEKRIPYIRDEDGEPISSDWWVSDEYNEYKSDYYPNLRDCACIAWMPFPKPYGGESDEID